MDNFLLSRDGAGKMEKINAGLIMLAEMCEKLPLSEKGGKLYISTPNTGYKNDSG